MGGGIGNARDPRGALEALTNATAQCTSRVRTRRECSITRLTSSELGGCTWHEGPGLPQGACMGGLQPAWVVPRWMLSLAKGFVSCHLRMAYGYWGGGMSEWSLCPPPPPPPPPHTHTLSIYFIYVNVI